MGRKQFFLVRGSEARATARRDLRADEARVAVRRVQPPERAVPWTRLWSETNPQALFRSKLSRGCEHLWTERADIGNSAYVDEIESCRARAKTKVGSAGFERRSAARRAQEL
jgi:hypothetical protein